MSVILLTILVNTGGFFIGGSILHWVYHHKKKDQAQDWKQQPKKWQTSKKLKEKIPLVLLNSVIISTGIGYGLWAAIEGLTPAYWGFMDKGPAWAIISTLLLGFWYHIPLYMIHKTMHRPMFYNTIHKVHHKYKDPMFLDALYEHPIEACYGALILGIPAMVFPIWMPGYFMFVGVVGVHEILDHSGINLNVPFLSKSKHHDIHHQRCHYYFGQLLPLLDDVFHTGWYPEEKAATPATTEAPAA